MSQLRRDTWSTLRRPRRTASRRLAIESLEDRLVLSTSQIDPAIWNVDSIYSEFAIISSDNSATPSANSGVAARETPVDTLNDPSIFSSLPSRPSGSFDVGIWHQLKRGGGLSAAGSVVDSSIVGRPPNLDLIRLEFVDPTNEPLITIRLDVDASAKLPNLDASPIRSVLEDRAILAGPIQGAVTRMQRDDPLSVSLPTRDRDLRFDRPDELTATIDSDVFGTFDSGSPESVSSQAFAGTGASSLNAESEGGSIPIEAIVADLASGQRSLAADGDAQVVDWTPKGDSQVASLAAPTVVVGELARAVAFESIDGDAATIVYAATEGSGGYAVTGELVAMASGDVTVDLENQTVVAADDEAFVVVAADGKAIVRSGAESVVPGTLAWILAAVPWSNVDATDSPDTLAESSRAEAFSQFAQTDAQEERVDHDGRPRVWLAAMPVLAVLAAERVVASKKRRERDASSANA